MLLGISYTNKSLPQLQGSSTIQTLCINNITLLAPWGELFYPGLLNVKHFHLWEYIFQSFCLFSFLSFYTTNSGG
jgi:hypothetical protein